jgi:hypothetical protein
MTDVDTFDYQWYCIDTGPSGRRRKCLLPERMTKREAAEWSTTHMGKVLELVRASGEKRTPSRNVRPARDEAGSGRTSL